MPKQIEVIHTADRDPSINLPYAPAVKVTGGSTVYLAGVTCVPIYHHHPHQPEEFENIPDDMSEQTRMTLENVKLGLDAVEATFSDIVQVTPLPDRHRRAGPDERCVVGILWRPSPRHRHHRNHPSSGPPQPQGRAISNCGRGLGRWDMRPLLAAPLSTTIALPIEHIRQPAIAVILTGAGTHGPNPWPWSNSSSPRRATLELFLDSTGVGIARAL